MADQADVRRLALALPQVVEDPDHFAFSVVGAAKPKGIAWVWLERVDPKKGRIPQPEVLAVRVSGETEKQALLASDRDIFFTEPHYNGFPAVLVRLGPVGVDQLAELLKDAWRCQAPRKLVKASGI